jgi:hypothetical protein
MYKNTVYYKINFKIHTRDKRETNEKIEFLVSMQIIFFINLMVFI